MTTPLPIDEALPRLRHALQNARACVLEAPPGAGKTTRVPLALLNEPWLNGQKILMLEPRRVAARAAAARMASELGEPVGETVGYRVRLDARVGPRTRIEVLTEGLLTRRLQSDPGLDGVALVIFDEFHERSLNADLALALTMESQSALNEKLKILVMSATLDAGRVATLVGGDRIRAEGRQFPVNTRYIPRAPQSRLDRAMCDAVRLALRETTGGILAFLPGEGEIRQVVNGLDDLADQPDLKILPLYGAMTAVAQDAAIGPSTDGSRKIVLATSIAETSLTIEGVRVVIDCGLQRLPRYDPASGMTRLITQTVSLASADQRRGRAGRVAPGICYRLWAEPETRGMIAFTPPEILTSDLSAFLLEVANWGATDLSQLALLDTPPSAALAEARNLLERLEAIDGSGHITAHGKTMAAFGAHPRLSHMMIRAVESGEGATAVALAAILGERDIVRNRPNARDVDLRLRLEVFSGEERDTRADRSGVMRAREQAKVWRRALNIRDTAVHPNVAGVLVALAYPDRIAQRRARGSFLLSGGRGAVLTEHDPLASSDYLSVAVLDGGNANAQIQLAAPLDLTEIERVFADRITARDVVAWDARECCVVTRQEDQFAALILRHRPLQKPDPDAVCTAVISGIRNMGLGSLNWTSDAQRFRMRVQFCRQIEPDATWPDMSDSVLLETLETWLAPFLSGINRASAFVRIDLLTALKSLLNWDMTKRLDFLAPEFVNVPSGSRISIDYDGPVPVLAVRLQEMFGLADTPTIGNGKVSLTLHLLSPARRPVQITRDLKSFWTNIYPDVKKDLKGRYPKHAWPDDPWTATPTARAKPRGT